MVKYGIIVLKRYNQNTKTAKKCLFVPSTGNYKIKNYDTLKSSKRKIGGRSEYSENNQNKKIIIQFEQ